MEAVLCFQQLPFVCLSVDNCTIDLFDTVFCSRPGWSKVVCDGLFLLHNLTYPVNLLTGALGHILNGEKSIRFIPVISGRHQFSDMHLI